MYPIRYNLKNQSTVSNKKPNCLSYELSDSVFFDYWVERSYLMRKIKKRIILKKILDIL
jgi:hypothetical protein